MKKIYAILALLIIFLMPAVVKAEEIDPCWDGNCSYVVNASTNTTTIVRLSDAEIEARKNVPAPISSPVNTEPTYDLVVVTPKQSFGTNGTLEQLTNVVTQIEQEAKSANDNKYYESCLYTDCYKYVADGMKVEVKDLDIKDLKQRAIARIDNAERLTELAIKAREVLAEVEVMSKALLPLVEQAVITE